MSAQSLVEEIARDREHGAAWLSLRALRGLGERAQELAAAGDREDAAAQLRRLALDLAGARPLMAAIRNRVHRLMRECGGAAPELLAAGAAAAVRRAEAAERGAAERAAERVAGRRLLTLSRSATVTAALLAGRPREVIVAESRPGGEGVPLAAELASAGLAVRLVPDAALAAAAAGVELVLVGADAVLPDGSLVNKVGSRIAALAAREAGIPFLATASSDKVGAVPLEDLDREMSESDAAAPVPVWAPLFDRVPAALVSGVVTELGTLDAARIGRLAAELEALERW